MNFFGYDLSIKRTINRSFNGTKGIFKSLFGAIGFNFAVNERTVLGLSAYWAGVRRISETMGMLPVSVIIKEGNKRTPAKHRSEYLLNVEANNKTGGFDFTQILIASAINHGNGFAIIERDGFYNPISLVNVRKDCVDPIIHNNELFYKVKIDDSGREKDLLVSDMDMINIRGFGVDPIIGLSAIEIHRQNLGLSIAAQEYGADFYKKGTRIDGYIEYDGKLGTETKTAIAEQWRKNYGPNGKRGVAVLDNGTKYTPLQLKPADAEFIATRKFQSAEIAKILNVPLHMINELENATFSNIEHQGIEFVTYSIGPWITKIEQEYRRKLLKESEKPSHQFKHNVNILLRTDVKAKAEHYRLMSDIGAYSINDILALEDRNPIENGDERYVQLNRIPIDQIKDYYKTKPKKEKDD